MDVIQLNEDTEVFESKGTFEHPYPTTKIMWIPDKLGTRADLVGTTGKLSFHSPLFSSSSPPSSSSSILFIYYLFSPYLLSLLFFFFLSVISISFSSPYRHFSPSPFHR